ncbi:hypothetical protein [Streptomyces bikiniensis]|uniref:hypothetical protein n=1 Tax=Streptomyces bikiniensis TaxID=1896 RepID=UPI0004BECDEF|nr:hypothetical protein [Streptomyces bikiniensis]
MDSWRRELPRSVPELEEAASVTDRSLAVLGGPGLAAARTAGEGLDVDGVLSLVEGFPSGAPKADAPTCPPENVTEAVTEAAPGAVPEAAPDGVRSS